MQHQPHFSPGKFSPHILQMPHYQDEEKDIVAGETPVDDYVRTKSGVDGNTEARLANPLHGLSRSDIIADANRFATEADLDDIREELQKGALVAADPHKFESIEGLSPSEKDSLRKEFTNPWKQPKQLYLLVICCSMAAVVQGQDQSLINGANIFFPNQFGIGSDSQRDTWLLGLVNVSCEGSISQKYGTN